jgi:quinol monooxygenase YgiN
VSSSASERVAVVALIRAKPGQEERVASELRALLEPTRAETGCLNFDMHRSTTDPGRFMFHENWTSEEALEAHFRTPHIQRWVSLVDELCAEPLDVTRWQPVA